MMQYIGIYFGVLVYVMIIMINYIYKKNDGIERKYFKYKSTLCYDENITQSISHLLLKILIFIYFVIASVSSLVYLNMNNSEYCNFILRQLGQIESSILTYFGVVISVIIFSVTLGQKEYYLTITREEVNRKFGIHIIFQNLCICAVASIVCLFLLPSYEVVMKYEYVILSIYEICCIGIIGLGMYGLIIIGILTLSGKRVELYSLNKLYVKFGDNRTLKLINYSDDVIRINLGYLLKKYIKSSYVRKRKLKDIKEIEFIIDSTKDKGCRKKGNILLVIFWLIATIISVLLLAMEKNYIAIIINIVLFLFMVIGMFFSKTRELIGRFSVFLILFCNGFMLRNVTKKNKDKFVCFWGVADSVYAKKYVQSLCNLMAFYCIICSCRKRKKSKKIADSLEDMVRYFDTVVERDDGFGKAMIYLPVFLCGYYYYSNFRDKKFPSVIVELYKKFDLSDDEEKRYFITINSFILYASRYRLSQIDIIAIQKGKCNEQYYREYIKMNGYSKLFMKKIK